MKNSSQFSQGMTARVRDSVPADAAGQGAGIGYCTPPGLRLVDLFGDWAREEPYKSALEPLLAWPAWELIRKMPDVIRSIRETRERLGLPQPRQKRIAPSAVIKTDKHDVYIGDGVYIGDHALVRGPAIILDGAIVGHASEVIHSFVGPKSRVTHQVTVAHSVIGQGVNIGASTCLASVSFHSDLDHLDKDISILRPESGSSPNTGLKKFGAGIGDKVKVGMNCSIGPGVILQRETWVWPNVFLRSGIYGPNVSILNNAEPKIEPRRPSCSQTQS